MDVKKIADDTCDEANIEKWRSELDILIGKALNDPEIEKDAGKATDERLATIKAKVASTGSMSMLDYLRLDAFVRYWRGRAKTAEAWEES